jgi:hypothetical protein
MKHHIPFLTALCCLEQAAGADPADWQELAAAFRDPPNAFRVVQYSAHEGAVMPIAKMRDYGIGGVMLFLSKHRYLRNDDAWENMKANIRLAKEAGMQVWVADDNGYPSGMAGGLVAEADPSFENRGLLPLVRRGQGRQDVRIDLPPKAEDVVSAMVYPERDGQPVYASGVPARVAGRRVESAGLEGPWVLYAFARQIINEGTQATSTAQPFETNGRYPNLLNPAAMAGFVDLTHAEYARRLGPLQGQIDFFYTNEPNLMTLWFMPGSRPGGESFLPWDAALPQRFKADHGYDLLPLLPALFAGDSDVARLVRRHFFQTVGAIFSDNYTGRIARWAEAHGVRSGGHLLLEERLDMHVIGYGDFFRALQDQHVPGCDVPMPDPGSYWNYWMPKLVSSAAQLRDRELVTALIDPIIDRQVPTLHPTPEEMMRVINMAFLTGVNQITSYIPWESYEPAVYRGFNEQVGRLAVMLRGARNASTIGMYYPIETAQSLYLPTPMNFGASQGDCPEAYAARQTQDRISRRLFENGYDYSWLDGAAILAGRVRQGRLVVGRHEYTAIIMPQVGLLPLPVMRKLHGFQQAGGQVLWVGSRPRLGDAPEEHAEVRKLAESFPVSLDPINELACGWDGDFSLRFEVNHTQVMVTRYRRQERCLYFIVNRSAEPLTVPLSSAMTSSITICNPVTGAMETQSLPLNLEIGAYQSRLAVDPNPPPREPPGTATVMPWQRPLPVRVNGIPNLARQAMASASSTHPNPAYSVYNAVDGNQDAGDWQHWCNADDAPATPAKPAWLMLEWPQPQTVRRAVVTFMKDYTVSDYELEYREQGTWKPFGAAQVQGNTSTSKEHAVAAPVAADAIRFLGKQGPAKQPTSVRVIEIEVFER